LSFEPALRDIGIIPYTTSFLLDMGIGGYYTSAEDRFTGFENRLIEIFENPERHAEAEVRSA